MGKKRKRGNKEDRLAIVLLITALTDLVSSIIDLIGKLIE